MKFWSLSCTCGCKKPMLRVTRNDGFESIVAFRTKEAAEAEAAELGGKSGKEVPLVLEFEVRAV